MSNSCGVRENQQKKSHQTQAGEQAQVRPKGGRKTRWVPTTADRKNLERKKVAEGIETFSTPWGEEGSLSNFGRQKVEGLQKGEPSLSWSMGKKQTQILTMQVAKKAKPPRRCSNGKTCWKSLQAAPIHNMVAKQAELLEIMEKLEGYCPEGTLQYWLLEHMYENLGTR